MAVRSLSEASFEEMRHDRGSMLGINNGHSDVSIPGEEPLDPQIKEAAQINAGSTSWQRVSTEARHQGMFLSHREFFSSVLLDRFECRWFLRLTGRVAGRNPADRIYYSDRLIADLSSNLA